MTQAARPLAPGRAYLGQGLAFPLRIDSRGRLASARAEAKVEQAIWLILSTATGERVMRPELGCAVHGLLFAPADAANRARLVDAVRRALTEQEPRIAVLAVTVDLPASSPTTALLRVNYRIHENNSVHNLVYPFYVTEGA